MLFPHSTLTSNLNLTESNVDAKLFKKMSEVSAAEKNDSEIPECQKFLIYFPEQKIFIRSFLHFIVVGVSLFTLSSARYANQAGM